MRSIIASLLACCFMWGATQASATRLPGQWMADYQDVPLNKLYIPGTHDSGAYLVDYSAGSSPDINISGVPDFLRASIAGAWGVAQGESVYQQAKRGYRYFDLRLCSRGSAVQTCHGTYMAQVDTVLRDLARFMAEAGNDGEVFILDFNHFHEMSPQHHRAVFAALNNYLGGRIADSSFSYGDTLHRFTSARKNVIVLYRDSAKSLATVPVWNTELPSPWPNVTSFQALRTYMAQYADGSPFMIRQLLLTPDTQAVVSSINPFYTGPKTLLQWTQRYQGELYDWLSSTEGKSRVAPGVLLVDFADDRLVAYAIQRNGYDKGLSVSPFATLPKPAPVVPVATPVQNIPVVFQAAVVKVVNTVAVKVTSVIKKLKFW